MELSARTVAFGVFVMPRRPRTTCSPEHRRAGGLEAREHPNSLRQAHRFEGRARHFGDQWWTRRDAHADALAVRWLGRQLLDDAFEHIERAAGWPLARKRQHDFARRNRDQDFVALARIDHREDAPFAFDLRDPCG